MARQVAPRRRATVWATLLVLVAALLQPALARLAPGGGSAWSAVCTAQGTRLVPLAADGEAQVSLHGAWDHCPWCLRLEAAPPPAPAGRPEPWPVQAGRFVERPAQGRAAPAPRPLPPPRGPPALPLG